MKKVPITFIRINGECNLVSILSALKTCSIKVQSFSVGNVDAASARRYREGYIPITHALIRCAASHDMVQAALNIDEKLRCSTKLIGAVKITEVT